MDASRPQSDTLVRGQCSSCGELRTIARGGWCKQWDRKREGNRWRRGRTVCTQCLGIQKNIWNKAHSGSISQGKRHLQNFFCFCQLKTSNVTSCFHSQNLNIPSLQYSFGNKNRFFCPQTILHKHRQIWILSFLDPYPRHRGTFLCSLLAHQGENVISTVWLSPLITLSLPQSPANWHCVILKHFFVSCRACLSTDVVWAET